MTTLKRTKNWAVKLLSAKEPTGSCEHQGCGCTEKAWFAVSHEFADGDGGLVIERLCERHARKVAARHGIRIPRTYSKSWGHRVEPIYFGQKVMCSINGCRCHVRYVAYYSYRAKSDGRVVSPSKLLCGKHGLAFSERHHIDFSVPETATFYRSRTEND